MKDLSKFYQRVDADPVAQNQHQVLWRGGDMSADMKVYITTTFNFGNKPAGCITIAEERETAERFCRMHLEAAWFLKYQTYVDGVCRPCLRRRRSWRNRAASSSRRL
jgi:hypothetical protein